ncbi:MAG: D-alanine--D-alanine ligase [Chloroflexota bacterium]|nr:D-alanine--D-alanine ligase [Chloroflexota bacterium]
MPYAGAPADYQAEFDTEDSIHYLETAIAVLGHDVYRIGNVYKLVHFLTEGGTVDIVFNMAEGVWGRSREAQVPAVLEAFQIPYTGSDPLTLALCLDKAMAKRLWQHGGVPTPRFHVVTDLADLAAGHDELPRLPLFVKPVHEGSSKGIGVESIVETEQQLRERVEWILTCYRQPVLIEEFLPGREFTVGILGNGAEARVLGIGELVLSSLDRVYGYTQKEEWKARVPNKLVPVQPVSLQEELSELALRAYHIVDCRDFGRLEIRLDRDDQPHVLELNPIVGLHPSHASLPLLAAQAGLSYEALIAEILGHATSRWATG